MIIEQKAPNGNGWGNLPQIFNQFAPCVCLRARSGCTFPSHKNVHRPSAPLESNQLLFVAFSLSLSSLTGTRHRMEGGSSADISIIAARHSPNSSFVLFFFFFCTQATEPMQNALKFLPPVPLGYGFYLVRQIKIVDARMPSEWQFRNSNILFPIGRVRFGIIYWFVIHVVNETTTEYNEFEFILICRTRYWQRQTVSIDVARACSLIIAVHPAYIHAHTLLSSYSFSFALRTLAWL